jgi:hypothetical protein
MAGTGDRHRPERVIGLAGTGTVAQCSPRSESSRTRAVRFRTCRGGCVQAGKGDGGARRHRPPTAHRPPRRPPLGWSRRGTWRELRARAHPRSPAARDLGRHVSAESNAACPTYLPNRLRDVGKRPSRFLLSRSDSRRSGSRSSTEVPDAQCACGRVSPPWSNVGGVRRERKSRDPTPQAAREYSGVDGGTPIETSNG